MEPWLLAVLFFFGLMYGFAPMATMRSQFHLERYALSAETTSTSSRGRDSRSFLNYGESLASASVTSMLGMALRMLVTAAWSFSQSRRFVLLGLGSLQLT